MGVRGGGSGLQGTSSQMNKDENYGVFLVILVNMAAKFVARMLLAGSKILFSNITL